MSSPLFTASPVLSRLPQLRYTRLLMTVILGASLVLAGCDNAPENESEKPKVEILADEVIVDDSLIYTSNPERYQPSYNLEGALIPVDVVNIETPYTADKLTLMVKEGDWVKKGQVIATLHTRIDADTARYTHYDFIDALIEGNDQPLAQQYAEQTAQSSTNTTDNPKPPSKSAPKLDLGAPQETASDPKSSAATPATDSKNSPSDTDTTQQNTPDKKSSGSESTAKAAQDLIDVTLVFKAPIEGEVTHINKDIKQALQAQITQTTAAADTDTDNTQNTEQSSDEASPKLSTESNSSVLDYTVPAKAALMTIGNTQRLQLIGQLPLSTESQLSVGRPVNFTVFDVNREFTGQISHITPDIEAGYLIVRAPLIPSDKNSAALKPGMRAAMSIDYGQTELGVRLPKQAIHEANLENLNGKHDRPTSAIKGFVWVIEQDQRLSYTPVEVIQYFPDSDKYLVHGINNDSLVSLADLPKDSVGKRVSVD